MHVVIVDINEDVLDKAVKSIKGVDGVGEVWGLKVDVSKIDEVVAMREKVFDEFGEVCEYDIEVEGADGRSMYSWPTLELERQRQQCPLLSPLANYRVIGEKSCQQIYSESPTSDRLSHRIWLNRRILVSSSIPVVSRVSLVLRKSHHLVACEKEKLMSSGNAGYNLSKAGVKVFTEQRESSNPS